MDLRRRDQTQALPSPSLFSLFTSLTRLLRYSSVYIVGKSVDSGTTLASFPSYLICASVFSSVKQYIVIVSTSRCY